MSKQEALSTKINDIELKANNLEKVKAFYSSVFNWSFTDYGPTYTAFTNSGLEGGFELSKGEIINGALVVLYHDNLALIKTQIEKSGGSITTEIFEFPGGKRFHFLDPSGNELAIWSDK